MPSIDRFRRESRANFEVRRNKLARYDRPEITEKRNLSLHACAPSSIDYATHGRQARSSSSKRANIFSSRRSSPLTPESDTFLLCSQLLRVNHGRLSPSIENYRTSFRSAYPYTRVSTVNTSKYIVLCIGQRVACQVTGNCSVSIRWRAN